MNQTAIFWPMLTHVALVYAVYALISRRRIAAVKAGDDKAFKMAGTGSKQEDQIITVAVEKVTGKKLTYVPYKGVAPAVAGLLSREIEDRAGNDNATGTDIGNLCAEGLHERLPCEAVAQLCQGFRGN